MRLILQFSNTVKCPYGFCICNFKVLWKFLTQILLTVVVNPSKLKMYLNRISTPTGISKKNEKANEVKILPFFKYDKVWHNVTLNSFVSAMQAISNCDSLIRLTNSKKPHRLSTRGDQFFLESVFLFRRRKWLLFSQLALTTKIENGEVWHCISTSEARLLTIRFENCILQQNT